VVEKITGFKVVGKITVGSSRVTSCTFKCSLTSSRSFSLASSSSFSLELVVAMFGARAKARAEARDDEWLADARERREGRCKGAVYNADLMVWMGQLIASDGGEGTDWVTELRDSVMNVARGETPYPPCSDIEGVRAHYECLFEDSMCMALIKARGGYEIKRKGKYGKGKGKGKYGKGGDGKDAEGDNDAAADDAPDDALAWLQKFLTMLQKGGWPADVFLTGKGNNDGKGKK